MNRNLILILLLILCVSLVVTGCGSPGKKNDLKAEITAKGETKIIKNPSAPLYGELKLELEETLTVGHGKDDFLSGAITGFDVDKNGNMFCLDVKENCFKVFDSKGKFIRRVGQSGMGPTDLYQPTMLQVDLSGAIYIYDNSERMRVFNTGGELVKIFPVKYFIKSVAPDGNFICRRSAGSFKDLEHKNVFSKVKADGTVVKEYISKIIRNQVRDPFSSGKLIFVCEFSHDIYCYLSKSGNLYVGDSSEYSIYVYDKYDNLIKEIRRDEKPVPISNKEKVQAVDDFCRPDEDPGIKSKYRQLIPDFRPFFSRFLVDDRERLYVFKGNSMNSQEPADVDVFDSSGRYSYRTRMPGVPLLIHNGYLYFSKEESEDCVVKKIKIKNL